MMMLMMKTRAEPLRPPRTRTHNQKDAFLFDWATLPPLAFARKLGTVYAGFMLAAGLPVSAVTFGALRRQ